MTEPKFIITENYSSKSQRFDELLSDGINFIQKFSGEKWTDYNYHDPGITLLEQICYAITDLGYKSNFPIEDLLLIGKDKYNLEEKNLFIPPQKIFSSSPLTFNDFRKIIIDKIKNVKNAWIQLDNSLGINGLYSIKIQVIDSLDEKTIFETIESVRKLLMENRSLCSDFSDIKVLKKDIISISADIYIDSFVIGEEVLAKINHQIESKLNRNLNYKNFSELEEIGYKYENLYQGPKTDNGFIDEDDLIDKTSEIFISELKEIINNIDGVVEIKNFNLYKNGIKIFEDFVSFDTDSYPTFESLDDYFNENKQYQINFYRNESYYEIDKVILSQIYDSLSIEENNLQDSLSSTKKNKKIARFSKSKLIRYFSIMRELPSIYGLKENELSSEVSNLRKSQVKQLKSYLTLFEQLMANHLSQLSSVRDFFSIDMSNYQTLFSQTPSDIPKFDEILINDLNTFEKKLKIITEKKEDFFRRKNKILDHMLSRFGESFDNNIIGKLHQIQDNTIDEDGVSVYKLNAKINYTKNLLNLNKNKSLGFNYESKFDFKNNISGIEKRLKIYLNILNSESIPDLSPYLNNNKIVKNNDTWKVKSVKDKNGQNLSFLSLPDNSYNSKEINFKLETLDSFKYLFNNAIKKKYFKIVKFQERHLILFYDSLKKIYIKIYNGKSLAESKNIISQIIQKYNKLNEINEGFYMIENILLRPKISNLNSLFIYNLDNKRILKNIRPVKTEEINFFKENLKIVLKDKSKYTIVKKNNSYKIEILDSLNKSILTSLKSFKKIDLAKNEIDIFLKMFDETNNFDDAVKTSNENINFNKFPQNFNFSNEINFIFPDWPFRFQNNEFISLIKDVISKFIPAQVSYNLLFLDVQEILIFDKIYKEWLNSISKRNSKKHQILSLEIIQLLIKYSNENGK